MDKATYIHEFDQMTGSFLEAAEALAVFRDALIERGFSEEGAENLTELLFARACDE